MKLSIKHRSGILLHPTALPGPYGVGDIGPDAYRFVDDLHDMGQSLWQILPIGPTDYCNSPYSSISTFAGNHLLISLDLLVEDGLLESLDITIEFNSIISYLNALSSVSNINNGWQDRINLSPPCNLLCQV